MSAATPLKSPNQEVRRVDCGRPVTARTAKTKATTIAPTIATTENSHPDMTPSATSPGTSSRRPAKSVSALRINRPVIVAWAGCMCDLTSAATGARCAAYEKLVARARVQVGCAVRRQLTATHETQAKWQMP